MFPVYIPPSFSCVDTIPRRRDSFDYHYNNIIDEYVFFLTGISSSGFIIISYGWGKKSVWIRKYVKKLRCCVHLNILKRNALRERIRRRVYLPKKETHCSCGIFNDTYAQPRISKKMILQVRSTRRRLSPFIYRSILLTSRAHPPSYYLSEHTYAYVFAICLFPWHFFHVYEKRTVVTAWMLSSVSRNNISMTTMVRQ